MKDVKGQIEDQIREVAKLEAAIERAQGIKRVQEAKRNRKRWEQQDRWEQKLTVMLKHAKDHLARLQNMQAIRRSTQMRPTASGRTVRV